LWPEVYDELRRLAAIKMADEPNGHTLDTTALVHEAFLKLAARTDLGNRSAYFRAAAVAMQRILVDHARRKRAEKRGGDAQRRGFREDEHTMLHNPDFVLDLDAALERLAAEDQSSAELARLRLFGGFSIEDAADALGLSRATAFREWAYARSWLSVVMAPEPRG
jgi:RNA polymerase sigma factor (TIGR02999 family)